MSARHPNRQARKRLAREERARRERDAKERAKDHAALVVAGWESVDASGLGRDVPASHALAMLFRPLVLFVLLYFIVKPLARLIMGFVKPLGLRRILLLRLGESIHPKTGW